MPDEPRSVPRARRLAVLSPHLDDAVFGCSSLIASHPGAVVITAFAGVPPAGEPLPEWDATCGFASAREAMLARRDEDERALALLHARPRWLDLPDAQYRRGAPPARIDEAIEAALGDDAFDLLAIPAGLFHEDHEIAHATALRWLQRHGDRPCIVYEEALYRRIDALLERRLAALRDAGLAPAKLDIAPIGHSLKHEAIDCYASQLRGLASAGRPGHDDLAMPEGYWALNA